MSRRDICYQGSKILLFFAFRTGTTQPVEKTCGVAAAKIVGGQEADPNSIPWQVGLIETWSDTPFCGGTIVTAIHVLSAAHCLVSSSFQVIVGEHDLTNSNDQAKRYDVDCQMPHPDYSSSTYDNDYAILTLKSSIDLTSTGSVARAACLPDSSDTSFVDESTPFVVSGWGTLSSGGSQPNVLHHVTVLYIKPENCKNAYPSLTDNMICAGNYSYGGVDSCQGDSGGKFL